MRRREALLAALAAASLRPARATDPVERFATAWRIGEADHRVGIVEVGAEVLRIAAEVPVPARAHGLLALRDGGFLAVANRPGAWLWRFDAAGVPIARLDATAESTRHTLNGHVETSTDGAWFYTTETDPRDGSAWIGVRDALTLQRTALWRSGGVDAHQLLRDRSGALLVANGGLQRDAKGTKIAARAIESSLVRIDAGNGRPLGAWRLADASISLRHLAWSDESRERLGIALQAEHADEAQRRDAPVLAVWRGDRLDVPSLEASAEGYAGDIAPGPGGGFVLSAQKARRVLWWNPAQPERLTRIAELTEPCGLSAGNAGLGVWISAGRGLARWHRSEAPRMQAWPVPLAPDNHLVRLSVA